MASFPGVGVSEIRSLTAPRGDPIRGMREGWCRRSGRRPNQGATRHCRVRRTAGGLRPIAGKVKPARAIRDRERVEGYPGFVRRTARCDAFRIGLALPWSASRLVEGRWSLAGPDPRQLKENPGNPGHFCDEFASHLTGSRGNGFAAFGRQFRQRSLTVVDALADRPARVGRRPDAEDRDVPTSGPRLGDRMVARRRGSNQARDLEALDGLLDADRGHLEVPLRRCSYLASLRRKRTSVISHVAVGRTKAS